MTSTPPSPAPAVAVADVFIAHLAARRFEQIAEVLEPDVEMQALLPRGLREYHGADEIVAAFVGWFGAVDEYEVVEATTSSSFGSRLQLQYRIRVRGGTFDTSHIVEQQVYADPAPSGRIGLLAMLCSGFAREADDD